MTPAQFLALVKSPDNDARPRPRDYRAGETGAGKDDHYLTLHCPGGLFYSLPFTQLQLIAGNRAGTVLELTFRMTFVLQGQQLQALTEGVRLRRITRLHVFDGTAHDPPTPGEPLITALELKSPTTARA
jgi:hypothetical protein